MLLRIWQLATRDRRCREEILASDSAPTCASNLRKAFRLLKFWFHKPWREFHSAKLHRGNAKWLNGIAVILQSNDTIASRLSQFPQTISQCEWCDALRKSSIVCDCSFFTVDGFPRIRLRDTSCLPAQQCFSSNDEVANAAIARLIFRGGIRAASPRWRQRTY